MGVEDKTDMSEDYNKFDEIPPFTVKTDSSIVLNDEDCPWLWHNQKKETHTKKKFIYHDTRDGCWWSCVIMYETFLCNLFYPGSMI